MFDSERRGVLVSGGKPWSVERLCHALSGDPEANRRAIAELMEAEVLKRDALGCLFSSRMLKDEKVRLARSLAGLQPKRKAKAEILPKQNRSKTEAAVENENEEEEEEEKGVRGGQAMLALPGGGDGDDPPVYKPSKGEPDANGKPRERRPLWDWAACHGYGGLDAKRTKAQAKELGAMERDLVALGATPADCDARWDILARLWKVPPTVRSLIKHWHECVDHQAEADRRIYGELIRA
jgi:hypothetical protein